MSAYVGSSKNLKDLKGFQHRHVPSAGEVGAERTKGKEDEGEGGVGREEEREGERGGHREGRRDRQRGRERERERERASERERERS